MRFIEARETLPPLGMEGETETQMEGVGSGAAEMEDEAMGGP